MYKISEVWRASSASSFTFMLCMIIQQAITVHSISRSHIFAALRTIPQRSWSTRNANRKVSLTTEIAEAC